MSIIALPAGGQPATMTSLELVDFINSQRATGEAELRHDHFMAKVPKVLGDTAPNFSGTVQRPQPAGGFRDYPCYRFPKREACLMAMSYSYELQAKVFDRMTALEEKPAHVDPQEILRNPAAMRGLLLGYTEKVLELESKVEELRPMAVALAQISASANAITITQAAKILGVKRAALIDLLRVQGWIYRQNASWVAYDRYEKNGYLQYKEARYTDEKTGQECISPYCHIKPKGLTKLALILGVTLDGADIGLAA